MTLTTYLNNLGIINVLGASKAEVCKNLLNNDTSGMTPYDKLFSGRSTWVGEVNAPLKEIPKHLAKYDCKNNRLLATAYESLATDVASLKEKYGKQRIGVVLGTSTSGILSTEIAYKQHQRTNTFPEDFDYVQQEIGTCSEFLAQYADVEGIVFTISTACSTSGKAFASAQRLIEADLCDAVIVGGSDSLCEFTLNGFDSLEVLSAERCNPLSKNRAGLNLGEGAALFILSKEPSAIKLAGVGESSDGYHVSAPDPKGTGAKIAMRSAMKAANVSAEDVGYINLHGTASSLNDKAECSVIYDLFADMPYCSSTKPLIGHTLGAAGAQDVALCWLLLSECNPQHILPAQVWDNERDPELAAINISTENTFWEKPVFVSNSFGFGGTNVCVIIEKVAEAL